MGAAPPVGTVCVPSLEHVAVIAVHLLASQRKPSTQSPSSLQLVRQSVAFSQV